MAIINTPVMYPANVPMNYVQPVPQTQPQVFMPYPGQNQNANNSMIMGWVQGNSGAKAFPLGPNCRAFLFDSENDCFYVKSTDQSGMPQPLRCFDYQERIDQEITIAQDTSNYVTKDELEEILSKALNKNNNRKENNNGKSFVRGNNESRNERSIQ